MRSKNHFASRSNLISQPIFNFSRRTNYTYLWVATQQPNLGSFRSRLGTKTCPYICLYWTRRSYISSHFLWWRDVSDSSLIFLRRGGGVSVIMVDSDRCEEDWVVCFVAIPVVVVVTKEGGVAPAISVCGGCFVSFASLGWLTEAEHFWTKFS